MRYLRAKPEHPLYRKLEQVFELMDQLHLSIENDRMGRTYVESDGQRYHLLDLESDMSNYDLTVGVLPPTTEWKLVRTEPCPHHPTATCPASCRTPGDTGGA